MFAKYAGNTEATRRASPRRDADNCITVIDGKAHPVHNWSDGGLLIHADERMFSMAAPIQLTMKFRVSGNIIDIPHQGRIIRKTRDRVAIEFEALTAEVSRRFRQVIDDFVTREFVESQTV